MSKILNDDLIYLVLSIVDEIPEGFIATYGQIALLANIPKNSRLVGKILSMADYYGQYPCHRVVDHSGRLAPHFKKQKELLINEGVTFKNEKCVDIKKHKWKIE